MELERLLKAFGEPMRLKIYLCLLERKHCVRSLAKKLGITESAISQHLKILREAGLIYGEKFGYHTHYLPKQEAIDYLASSVIRMQQKSKEVDRDVTVCQCEFRKEEQA